jgi:arylsulfatase A-like enzyme/tetratricopeptide (TPR) repeat protein
MRTKIILLLMIIVMIAMVFIWKSQKETLPGFGDFQDYNLLLVTIDTLRADHLPAYGYTKIHTPNLDRLANESFVFEDVVAQVPMTLPSHTCILTGLLPPAHGIRDNAGFILDSKVNTLAETLKSKNYETAAFISAFILDSQFGLDQGFDHYSDNFSLVQANVDSTHVSRRAEETELEVDAWLRKNSDQKFFLWVHYYDPHDPYDPPEPYKTEYASSLYDGEIAYTDHVFGKLYDLLDQLQLREKTIVIMTGDHGEGLGDHKEQTHSIFIYNATQHVPLMIRLPKIKPERIKGVVSLVDIVPTVLEWLGVQPDQNMQGRSLIPLIEGKDHSSRAAYSESIFPELHYGFSPLKRIATDQYEFIDAPNPEVYDRVNDRSELKNLIKEKPEIANALQKRLDEILKSSQTAAKQTQKMDPETEEKLRAMGYVGTIVASTPESLKIDPKDKIDLLEAISQAHQALTKKNFPFVVETTTRILQQDPNIVDAHYLLASAYLSLNENEKALTEMLKTIQLKPDHSQTLYNLAFYYQLQGNLDEAEKWYLQLLKVVPEHLSACMNLIDVYRQKNEPEKAKIYLAKIVASYEKALKETEVAENRAPLLEKLAQAYFAIGDLEQSEKTLKEGIQLMPNRPMTHFHLGAIYQQKKEFDKAIAEYEAESKISPNNFKAFFNLGVLYRHSGQLQNSIQSFQKALQLNNQFYPTYYQLAEVYLITNSNLDEALRLVELANQQTPTKEGELLRQTIAKKLIAGRNSAR